MRASARTSASPQLRQALGDQVDVVAAIVTYDEPTATIVDYAPYTLKVNA